MRFEGLLARRYIGAQKRHSALTICSISIAVALLTMLFTCYGTFIRCLRDAAYDSAPYHYRFFQATQEQADTLKTLDEVESFNISKNQDGSYQVDLLFKKNSLDDTLVFDQELSLKLDIPWPSFYLNMVVNRSLMDYDLVDDSARFMQLQIFCIFFIFVICLALMLRLIIDTAFEISSKERERQFGVLQSIGATPKQVVRIITAEGLMLSIIGLPIGILLGIAVAYAAFNAVLSSGIADAFFTSDKAEQLVRFHISPLMLLISAVVGLAWVLFSAYGTGMRIIKMSPVEAISSRSNKVKKIRRRTLTGLLFGWVGKLASRNARRQKKRFIITILSLTLSITLFASLGAVFTTVIEFEETALAMGYGVSDFEVLLLHEINDPTGYRDALNSIENSGYFKDTDISVSKYGSFQIDGEQKTVIINYSNRASYENFFGGKPPVPYDELVGTKNYVYASTTKTPESISSLTGNVQHYDITDELLKSAESRISVTEDGFNLYSAVKQEIKDNHPEAMTSEEHTFSIAGVGQYYVPESVFIYMDYAEEDDEYLYLLATLEQYEAGEHEVFGNLDWYGTFASLTLASDDKYSSAMRLIENDRSIELDFDNYINAKKLRATTSALRIGSAFLTAMIAISAIVNMINIISTGIINRRSEIASMQCVGMTQGQLRAMVIVEALQYTLISAIAAVIICLLILSGTRAFLVELQLVYPEKINELVKFSEVLWRAGVFAFIALAVSIIAALLPLRRMKKASLVEQIRSVD